MPYADGAGDSLTSAPRGAKLGIPAVTEQSSSRVTAAARRSPSPRSSSRPPPRDRPSMPQASGDDGLNADPEPSITVSANRAAEAEGHEDDGKDHDHPVDQR